MKQRRTLPLSILAGAALALPLALLPQPAAAEQLSRAEFNTARRQLQAAVSQNQPAELEAALRELARDDSERAVEAIIQVAIGVPQGAVLAATTRTLASMRGDAPTEAMAKTVEGRRSSPAAKILCIDALAGRSCERSGRALGEVLADRRTEVVRAALEAVRKRKEVHAVDGLIDLFGTVQGRDTMLEDAVESALLAITGQTFATVADWKNYWAVARTSGGAAARPTTGGNVRGESGGTQTRAPRPTFYGSEISSDRVVFVIDISGSMQGRRMEKMQEQLKGALDGLGPQPISSGGADEADGTRTRSGGGRTDARRGQPRSRFTIIAYDHEVTVWEPRLQLATLQTVERAKTWVDNLAARGATFTQAALLRAFEVDGIDTIVLLSDGMPTDFQPPQIIERVDEENRFRRLRIDAYGFAEVGPGLNKFMKDLAEANGGKFTAVR